MTNSLIDKMLDLKSRSGRNSSWNDAIDACVNLYRAHQAEQPQDIEDNESFIGGHPNYD